MHLIGALWRGERSLRVTYWIFGAAIYFGINMGMGFVQASELFKSEALVDVALTVLVMVLLIAYLLFISVAIWRSASAYQGKPMWAALAKFSVALGLINFAMDYAFL